MKRFKKFSISLICVVCMLAIVMPVSAARVGDIIAKTVYTDIVASINDYNIASYNINDYTAVVAEDLRNYGFNVTWVPEERALYIERASSNVVTSTYIAPQISSNKIGKKAQDVLYTDIKTYINGAEVTSYNIGGNTIIYFDDLSVFGSVEYNDSRRRLDLSINDGLNYKISPPYKYSKFSPTGLYFKTNSVDGLQVRWTAYNNTNKTINYYTAKYYMFNSVWDLAYDRWGKNNFSIKTVGPVKPGETIINYTSEYEGEVYDAPVEYIVLYEIFVEYNDGTSETIYYNHIGQEYSGDFVL